MMRVITGKYKGRQLKTPGAIRPTEDRIRKSLFDIIDPENSSFLELFAGSGSVGFEALSLGASKVTFVEKERDCARIIEENSRKIAAEAGSVEILNRDALDAVLFLCAKGRKFDYIFLDPPYYIGLAEKTLQLLGQHDILHCSGTVIVQHFKKDVLPEAVGLLTGFRQARYGDSLLSFYALKPLESHEQKSDLSGNL